MTRRRYVPQRVTWTRQGPGRYIGTAEDGTTWHCHQWASQDWRLCRDGLWEDFRGWSLEDAQRHADDETRQAVDPEYAARVKARRAARRARREGAAV